MTPIKIEMDYVKSTKNTHVYSDCSELTPVPTLYIKRSALSVDKPKTITVTISD